MLLATFVRVLFDDDSFYECRQCGTTLENKRDSCPHCSSSDVVRYDAQVLS